MFKNSQGQLSLAQGQVCGGSQVLSTFQMNFVLSFTCCANSKLYSRCLNKKKFALKLTVTPSTY